jgi:hypothetical protein
MAYDRADWHYGGDFPASFPQEAGGTHIAFFVCWMMLQGHVGPDHANDKEEVLAGLKNRTITPTIWFFQWCDGKFWKSDLDDEGNKFAHEYYGEEGGKYKAYLNDYERTFSQYPEVYGVPDTWDKFDAISVVIDDRYRAWKKRRRSLFRWPFL